MVSIVFFIGTFVNNDLMSEDTKAIYSSLIWPSNIEFTLAAASKESLTTYLFCVIKDSFQAASKINLVLFGNISGEYTAYSDEY